MAALDGVALADPPPMEPLHAPGDPAYAPYGRGAHRCRRPFRPGGAHVPVDPRLCCTRRSCHHAGESHAYPITETSRPQKSGAARLLKRPLAVGGWVPGGTAGASRHRAREIGAPRAQSVCAAMVKNIEWLLEQNAKRASRAKSRRKDRGGQGRALARKAWIARRSAARRAVRMRREVVGRVRLWGKGPPPRLGPLNKRRVDVANTPAVVDEPFDNAAIALVEAVWAKENEAMLMGEVLAARGAASRRPRQPPVAARRDIDRCILWGINRL